MLACAPLLFTDTARDTVGNFGLSGLFNIVDDYAPYGLSPQMYDIPVILYDDQIDKTRMESGDDGFLTGAPS